MTFIKDVFLKGNLQVNKFILDGMKDTYFAEDIIKSSPVMHLVNAIVDHDGYDFTMESKSDDDRISHRHIAFKQNTDTNLIVIELVKQGPLKTYIPKIRQPKQMLGYLKLMQTIESSVKEKHRGLLCKLVDNLKIKEQQSFHMDIYADEEECSIGIECLKSRLWVNMNIDIKEFKKLN